jgi:signal transduction histidine kinase
MAPTSPGHAEHLAAPAPPSVYEISTLLKRTTVHEAFLAEASAILASSMDYRQNLASIARLAVPAWADVCVAQLAEDGRRPLGNGAAQDREQGRLPSGLDAIQAAVLRDTVPLLHHGLGGDVGSSRPEDENASDALGAAWVGSVIVVPLLGRGRALGTLTFAVLGADRRYAGSDLAFGQELAGQASLAIESAELDRRAQSAREDLLGLVSHDLQNPINTLQLHAQLLQRPSAALEANRLKSAESILRATDRMNRLICDLVDARSIGRGDLAMSIGRHDVKHLVDELLAQFQSRAAAKSLQLRGPMPPDVQPMAVLGDRERILQALSNLVDNAIKFTDKGGAITIAAEPLGAEVRFSVVDSGCGIAAADIPRVFDPYGRAADLARHGTGFGLLIARGIVKALGGRLWVESEVGAGSTFFAALPSVT